MRIRSYLALLVLSCLIGAYTLEQVLGQYFIYVQEMVEKHNKNQLWAKDLERIEASTSQFLVSSDLVVGSGNTYLIFGAQNMGDYLTTELSVLKVENSFADLNQSIDSAIAQTNKIKAILDVVGNIPAKKLKLTLGDLLAQYDPVSLLLSQNIMFLVKATNSKVVQEALHIQHEKRIIANVAWLARAIFFILIIALWWWANKKICSPLNELIYSSHRALAGEGFRATTKAPAEIIELSNDFKHITEILFHQASHDPLTELQNRRAFERCLNEIMPDNSVNYFLCFIDLDYFKTINDTCGHAAGDDILTQVARALKENIRYKDTVCRLGGDEFAVLIADCSTEKALEITNTFKKEIQNITYYRDNESFKLSASIGIAPKMENYTISDFLHSADVACASAKTAGRNTVRIFDITSVEPPKSAINMVSVHQINQAVDDDLFILFKQNITALAQPKHGQYIEILLRMKNAHGGFITPENFLPTAERYKLSSEIDRWVITNVYQYFCHNIAKLAHIDIIAINLSSQALLDHDFELFIVDLLQSGVIPAHKICFEINETDAITHIKPIRSLIKNLSALGCEFALDDVGAGQYSYAYMKEFANHKIKISGTLINQIQENKQSYNTVYSICENAKSAHQQVIAKSVEDANLVAILERLGVDYIQGFYTSYPEQLYVI